MNRCIWTCGSCRRLRYLSLLGCLMVASVLLHHSLPSDLLSSQGNVTSRRKPMDLKTRPTARQHAANGNEPQYTTTQQKVPQLINSLQPIPHTATNKVVKRKLTDAQTTCPNVLSGMVHGLWDSRPLTKQEDDTIMTFLTNAQTRFRFPSNYERPDKQCGNVTHTGTPEASHFRALCDPKGQTPCCYNKHCVERSVEDCQCDDCYDIRSQQHAEYSRWNPADGRCKYKTHSSEEACAILNGMDIMFVGDSLIRHIYTAILLVVTGNMEHGAIHVRTKQSILAACKGMYMFTEKECRLHLNKNIHLCNGTVHLRMLYYFFSGYGQHLYNDSLAAHRGSLVLAGIGVHSHFNAINVQNKFLLPTLERLSKENKIWPKFVWATHHAPGILKSPFYLSQSNDGINKYNAKMVEFCQSWNIPVFDTFNMTEGMTSFDGEHYGIGMNIVKANIILSYVHELRSREKW